MTNDEFVITRIFDATRELVWKTWTEPEHIKKLWMEVEIFINHLFFQCTKCSLGLPR